MDLPEEYDRNQQRSYQWACGSCNFRGAPGYCARNMTHGIRPSKHCGCYYPSRLTDNALKEMAGRGLFTGDAFTSRNDALFAEREPDTYLWVWQDGKCDFIDFYPDTKAWIHVDPKGIRLRSTDNGEKQDIPFEKIKNIWLQQGNATRVIYSRQAETW